MIIYEVSCWSTRQHIELDNKIEARAVAEGYSSQYPEDHIELKIWNRHPNIPFAKPDYVDSICAMYICKNGKWFKSFIHTPHYEEWPMTDEDWRDV